jgi:hypothetical protein
MSGTELDLPETMHIEGDAESPEHKPSPRDLAMAAIVARAEERRQAELAQSEVFDKEAREAGLAYQEDAPEPAPEPVEDAPQEPAPQPPTPAPVTPQAPQLRSVVLDGQRWNVTEEQFEQLAQLGMVANLAMHQPAPRQEVQQAPPRPIVDRDRVNETIKQIQYGGEEAAAEALTQLITDVVARTPVAPAIDPNTIVRQAAFVARQEAQLEADRARITAEYPDIFADPQRTMLARLNVDAIRARNMRTGQQQNDLDIYREAGNAVYDAMGKPRPGSEIAQPTAIQAAAVPIRADVIERKRAAPRTTQVIDRRAAAPEPPRAPTGGDIVEQMRRARGQSSMR